MFSTLIVDLCNGSVSGFFLFIQEETAAMYILIPIGFGIDHIHHMVGEWLEYTKGNPDANPLDTYSTDEADEVGSRRTRATTNKRLLGKGKKGENQKKRSNGDNYDSTEDIEHEETDEENDQEMSKKACQNPTSQPTSADVVADIRGAGVYESPKKRV